jgi:probable F420-dependent oxidoreductase
MQLGVFLPYTEIGTDPSFIRDFAQAAEDLGYNELHIPDHPVRVDTSSGDTPSTMYDPFVLFANLAASTRTIELVTSILVLPQRQTVLVAKQAAELDILSSQRLRIGLGTGAGPRIEYDALGSDYRSRGRRQEEQVHLLRLLWKQDTVDFHGAYHEVAGAGIHPRPGREIPIWFGGGDSKNPQTAEPVLRRMARVGDGWLPLFRPDDNAAMEARDRMFGYLREEGRDPSTFGIEGFTHMRSGDPERWRERISAWQAFGAGRVCLRPMGMGPTGPDAFIDAIRRYREAILG